MREVKRTKEEEKEGRKRREEKRKKERKRAGSTMCGHQGTPAPLQERVRDVKRRERRKKEEGDI